MTRLRATIDALMVLGSLPHTMRALACAGEAGNSFEELSPDQRRLLAFAALAVMRVLAASGVGLEPSASANRERVILAAIRRLGGHPCPSGQAGGVTMARPRTP